MTQVLVRPPVAVVLGHVDHGKTTLLDYIRKTNQTTKEVGGITQTIGAYEVETSIKGYPNSKITFIDTPGHEAFSRLRSRGAAAADIAILIVDAVDSVMPQTIEALSHIKTAQIPFVVAINKIDVPQANLDKVKHDLTAAGVAIEGLGGTVPVAAISAKTGQGVADLLETILIIAAEQKTTFSPTAEPKGVVIEVKKDKRGVVVSAILKDGRLKTGDFIYADNRQAKIKALIDDHGRPRPEVYPSTPFLILGFNKIPPVGATLRTKPAVQTAPSAVSPTDKHDPAVLKARLIKQEEHKKLKVIIKTNVQGSLETICHSLDRNDNVEIVMATVGEISKSDVFLAKITQAIIIGFSLTPDKTVRELAEQEKVVIKTYDLIYQLLEELTEVSSLIFEKEKKAKQLIGEAKILAQFIIEKERVAGVKVTKGKLALNDNIELYRGGRPVGRAKIASLKIRAKPTDEVKKSEEAGMIFYPQLDFAAGDVIKSHSI